MNIIHPFGGKQATYETEFAGKKLTIETGNLAFLATGAVTVRYGDTVVFASAVVAPEPKPDQDFFPLLIDYEERMYAAGKISGSRFIKREGRPSEKAILTARLIDRPIRPLFPKGYRNDVQIVVMPLSVDMEHEPDIIGIIAASSALMLTGAPFEGPVAGIRIGQIDGKLVPFPTNSEQDNGTLNLTVAGTKDAIMMVEAAAQEVSEETMLEALQLSIDSWKPVIELQEQMVQEMGVQPQKYDLFKADEELTEKIEQFLDGKLGQYVRHTDGLKRQDSINELREMVLAEFGPLPAEMEDDKERFPAGRVKEAFTKAIDNEIRRGILEDGERPDQRKTTEIRPISGATGVLPRTHGSAIFTRGTTQALTLTTLAPTSFAQLIDTMEEDTSKRYMHHYNFPPYSTGEARPLRGTGRREIGHGALAERALEPMIPSIEDFPYASRVVSEILSSNGSTSMASVCGSTLSLMDAGVPLKRPISGIAMGLVIDHANPGKYIILSDIQGAEDFAGDMDFKVAGSSEGITALQMDIKVKGITVEIMRAALAQAKEGRAHIMGEMMKILSEVRPELSLYAPRITKLTINPDKIKEVIGKGGETIRKITEETETQIDIEDSGLVMIYSEDAEKAQKAKEWIEAITAEPEVGKIYDGTVVKLMEFGAFVEFMPGREGLVHISQIADHRVEKVSDELREGDKIKVKLVEKDDKGRFNLSKKAAQSE
ncbi:polyribonucleotide nucleotidyltransferase [bacterium]|nr:polyribonucleotide nucleotidyltransferase [bacterium]